MPKLKKRKTAYDDVYVKGKYLIIDEGTPEIQQDIIDRYIKARQEMIGRALTEIETKELIKKLKRKIKNGELDL